MYVLVLITCGVIAGADMFGEGVDETAAEGLDGRIGGNIGLDGCARWGCLGTLGADGYAGVFFVSSAKHCAVKPI